MIKRVFFLLLFTLCGKLYSQEIEFGEIEKAALEEVRYEKDSTTAAVFLYKFRHSYFQFGTDGLRLITEVHERIKIYDQNGLEYATKVVDLYQRGSKKERASAIKGYTYNLVDGKVQVTKLGKESYFRLEQSENNNQLKISMPKAKVGSVIEYKYKIYSPFYSNIDEFVIQDDIPAKKVDAVMTMLQYFKFNILSKGFLKIQPVKAVRRDRSTDLDLTTIYIQEDHVPALKKEGYVSNIENYRSTFKFEITSIRAPNYSENLARTWEDVAKIIYKNTSFGYQLARTNYFESDLDAQLEGISDAEKKITTVQEFVKKKVKWNKRRGVLAYSGVRKAYKEGVGNVADVNLILVAMLRHAGLDAQPVLVSTRDNGIPLYPTLEGFNYVIAAVKLDEDYMLLDATETYSLPNVLPKRVLNWDGRIITKEGNSFRINLMPTKTSLFGVFMNATVNDDGSVEGKLKQRYTNQNSLKLRSEYYATDKDAYLEQLELKNKGIEISGHELRDDDDLSKPVTQYYDFFREDMVGSSSGKLYLVPMLHLATYQNPFKTEKREYPVYFAFPWVERYIINIKIPDGYEVGFLPESTSISLPNGLGAFKYDISVNLNTLILNTSVNINSSVIDHAMYPELKEFFKNIVEKQTEQVVLKKI